MYKSADRILHVLIFFVAVIHYTCFADSRIETQCIVFPSQMAIDRAWGGVPVSFNGVENSDYIYVGYFDADRWLSIAQISKCTGTHIKMRVPSRFNGWDSHNTIALSIDNASRLHISGNMHVSPLIYARMDKPDQLTGIDTLRPMVSRDEDRATYPNFFKFSNGTLGFSYRSGHSGNGVEIINRYEDGRWLRLTDQPIFGPSSGQSSVSAYHSGFVFGPDNYFHVAWVWRGSSNVETNFKVNYAKSADLQTWKNSRGEVVPLPITPANAEVVDPVPKESGLFNNVHLGFDQVGRPVISYLKFDNSGATQLFHARREDNRWRSVPATNWTYRWDPRGGGTIPSEISFSGVKVWNDRVIEQVHHSKYGSKCFVYTNDLHTVQQILKSDVCGGPSLQLKSQQVPVGAISNVRFVRMDKPVTDKFRYRHAISWFSHPADNRDLPRECKPMELPCDFVSELILHTIPITTEVGN